MSWNAKLESEFEAELRHLVNRAKTEANYPATYFQKMLAENGGRRTAEILLAKREVSDGFTNLWPDHARLTMGYVVASEPWCNIFDKSEVRTARQRLGRMAPNANP